jgi:hypothetical protein
MAKNVLECTGRYNGLVRNGIGGSLDQPCANSLGVQLYCNQTDVDAWNDTAFGLYVRVRSEWNATAKAHTIPPEVEQYVTSLETDYCTPNAEGQCETYWLPESSWWDTAWNSQASALIAKWCARAACALELLDNVRNIEAPIESTQQNAELDEHLAKGAGKLGEGLGEAIGGLGKGAGDAIGGLGKGAGGALDGLGKGLSIVPIALGVAAVGATVIGAVVLLRK